jgi:hypothetical protein
MTDEHFSQKEMVVAIMRKLDETHDLLIRHMAHEESQLEAIHSQALKTNGRVSKLEDEVDKLQIQNEGMAVKIAAAVFLATTLVGAFINKYFL